MALILCIGLFLQATGFAGSHSPVGNDTRQLLVVTTQGWDATDAQLALHERAEPGAPWQLRLGPLPAVVGRAGLAWGIGLHPDPALGALRKREGDGKAPAGVFRLGETFGAAPLESAPSSHMPYIQATPTLQCVDDPASPLYNRLADIAATPRTWASAETMARADGLYRHGAVVLHNAAPPEPGCGSCIFLHIWEGAAIPTSGCTAMAATDLTALLNLLDEKLNPLLVQLPMVEYGEWREEWGLP
jgi:L,D-peptidoglycan transpeptidase YkuD (ErfK/YbiS/YcfS/YnhG family)